MAHTTPAPEMDRSVLAYLEWNTYACAVRGAWSAWTNAPAAERSRRFAAYLEALDREERACELLRALSA